MKEIKFTHLWVDDFGWENTIFCKEDFDTVEIFGTNDSGEIIFIAIQFNGKKRILKGNYE